MYTVLIHIHVKPEFVDEFIRLTLDNTSNSILEPGIARFDLIRQQDDPTRFILYEIYRAPDAQAAHRETEHYLRWRSAVEHMMVEPRVPVKYDNISPVA